MCRPTLPQSNDYEQSCSPHGQKECLNMDQVRCGVLESNPKSSLRSVSFAQAIVSDVIYRTFTPEEEVENLYYQPDDYARFREEYRCFRREYNRMMKARAAETAGQLQVPISEQKQLSSSDVKLSCLERVTRAGLRLMSELLHSARDGENMIEGSIHSSML